MFLRWGSSAPREEVGLGGYGASELARDIANSMGPTISQIQANIAAAQASIAGAITEINAKAQGIYDNAIRQSQEFVQQANAQLTTYVQTQLGIVAADAEKTIAEIEDRTKKTIEQAQVAHAEWVNRSAVLETTITQLQDQIGMHELVIAELEQKVRLLEQQKAVTAKAVW